ncbi:hypothetical protein HMPREF3232_00480 [Fannyhessea vaginae]|nr:hypothetical protein HMPREF3232_00480 [Fannyhessea vaginae]
MYLEHTKKSATSEMSIYRLNRSAWLQFWLKSRYKQPHNKQVKSKMALPLRESHLI